MTATLIQEHPSFYSTSGDKALSVSVVENNHTRLQNWGNTVAQDMHHLEGRITKLEEMIKWIGYAYPEVIAGYKAVQDVERSVNS